MKAIEVTNENKVIVNFLPIDAVNARGTVSAGVGIALIDVDLAITA